jgi:hypothetical protein
MRLPDVREHVDDMSRMNCALLVVATAPTSDATKTTFPHAILFLSALHRSAAWVSVTKVKAVEFADLRAFSYYSGTAAVEFTRY